MDAFTKDGSDDCILQSRTHVCVHMDMGFGRLDIMPGFGFKYGRRTAMSNDKSFDYPLLLNLIS